MIQFMIKSIKRHFIQFFIRCGLKIKIDNLFNYKHKTKWKKP